MISIRDATLADMAAILPIYNDAVTNTTAVFDYAPRGLEAQQAWFAAKQEQKLPVLLAVEQDAVLGFASFGPFRPWPAYRHTVENSIYVDASARGRGAGRKLLHALIEACTARGFRQMVAVIGDSANAGSIALHRACGFAGIGILPATGFKFGRWIDTVLMQRALGPGDTTLPEDGDAFSG